MNLREPFRFQLNPVLLYELRQAVRNRFVLWLLLIDVLTLTLFFVPAVFLHSGGHLPDSWYLLEYICTSMDSFTSNLVFTITILYYVFTSVALAGFGALRSASDRLNESPIFYTTLPIRKVVSGKMQFGIVFGFLFLSVTFPFFVLAYWMRGVDLRLIGFGALCYFFMVQIHYFSAVTCFFGARSRKRLVALILPALMLQFVLAYFSLLGFPDLIYHFVFFSQGNNGLFLFCLSGTFAMAMTGLFCLSLVQIAPESSNRMFPVRVSASIVQTILIGVGLLFLLLEKTDIFHDDNEFLPVVNILFALAFPYLFLIFICERDHLSPRIRQTIPLTFWRRLLAFPFYTGAAGAILWCALTLFIHVPYFVLVGWLTEQHFKNEYRFLLSPTCFGLLLLNYCGTTLLLYHLVLRRWISREWNWIVPFAFLLVMTLFPMCAHWVAAWIGLGLSTNPFWDEVPILPRPWVQYDDDAVWRQLYFGGIWLLLLSVFGLPWIIRRFRAFRREETSP